jgi:hypothetical protein
VPGIFHDFLDVAMTILAWFSGFSINLVPDLETSAFPEAGPEAVDGRTSAVDG